MENISTWGVLSRQLTDRERWQSFWAMFAYGFLSIFNVYKLSSVLTYIGETFSIANVGMVQTLPAVIGLIIIFPVTWLIRKIGVKPVIMGSFIIMVIGTVATFFATDAISFLAYRCIECVGNQTVAVAGPQIMVRLFPQEKQGLVMGIWSTWTPCGAIGAFFAVPLLYAAGGWQALYVATIVLQVIVGVLLVFFFKMPAVNENERASSERGELPPRTSYFASALLMAFMFTGYVFCQSGVTNTFYPSYLQSVMGWGTFASSMPTLLAAAITIPVSFATGVLADRLNSRKYFAVVPYLVMAISYTTFAFTETPNAITPWAYGIVIGLCAGMIPMALRSIIPLLAYDPKKVDYALGLMAWCTPLGLLFTSSYSAAVSSMGYEMSALCIMAPIMAVVFLVTLFTKNDHAIEPPAEQGANAAE